jgi:prevent-host-death family protein
MGQVHVSIRELKSRLSHFLRLTASGEAVVVTERGVPVARIVPVSPRLDERLAAMQDAGAASWSGRKPAPRKPVVKARGGRSVADVLVRDRE